MRLLSVHLSYENKHKSCKKYDEPQHLTHSLVKCNIIFGPFRATDINAYRQAVRESGIFEADRVRPGRCESYFATQLQELEDISIDVLYLICVKLLLERLCCRLVVE